MLNLLVFLACQNLGLAASGTTSPPREVDVKPVPEVTPPRAVRMPEGRLVTRQCFGGMEEERSRATSAPSGPYGGAPTKSSSGGSSRSYQAAQPAPPPPAPPAAAAPSPIAVTGATTTADASSTRSLADEGSGIGGAGRDGVAARPATTSAPMDKKAEAEPRREQAKPKEDPSVAYEVPEAATEAQQNLDWGATVYLSNDDSMSLASAQRLLWAVQNKGPVSSAQIRPHEFLNYFSFDTETVNRGDTFSILGSAEQKDGDTVTMAFAVKGKIPERKPLDLTLVLDRSGSMSAEGRMDYLRRGLMKMTESLQPGDRVDFVLFDHEVCSPLENFVVGRDDMSILTGVIGQLQPRGSTDLDAGLREGYRIADTHTDVSDRNRRMLLISDALLNTGNIDPDVVSQVGKKYEQAGIRLTAVGVGRDFNDKVLDMLTEKGKGAYVYLGSEAVVDRVFGVGFASLTQTIAHDVRFALDLPDSLAMERFYGEEASTNPDDVQPINYYGGTAQLFLQDLKIKSGRMNPADPVKLTVQYTDADSGKRMEQVYTSTVGSLLASDPHNLHKGQALMAWTDMIQARAMGSNPCGEPFTRWQDRVAALGADAEISWLDGMTSPLCGSRPIPTPIARTGVPYKVKVDSDMPIAEVSLACNGWRGSESLSGSDTVASFTPVPGSCVLTLQGTVPMQTTVKVPETGADVRCTVRGGRMSCG